MRLILILILSLLMGGCGFNLRGERTHFLGCIKCLYLQIDKPYSPIAKDLRQILGNTQIELADCQAHAPFTLEIMDEDAKIYTGGFGFSNQVSVSVVKYHITYQLLNTEGKVLMRPRTISTQQSFTININQQLSGNLIPPSLLNEMRRQVIYQLMDHLSATDTQRCLGCGD